MARHGTWTETGGDSGKAIGAIAVVVVAGAVMYEAAKSAAVALGDLLVIIPVALGGIAVGTIVTVLAVRARGRRRTVQPAQVQLWHQNPRAIPAQPRRELPAPVVNVNIDAGLLAGLMHAAQQQPVIVRAETEELPR